MPEKIKVEVLKGKKGEFIFDNTKGKDLTAGFTLVVTFSRKWCVQNFFAAFNKLYIDMKNCHLIIFDNSCNIELEKVLIRKAGHYKENFASVRLYKSWRISKRTRTGAPDEGVEKSALPVIYAMHKDFLEMVKTDKFVLLEDDTLPPKNAVWKLLWLLDENPNAAIATAIATGRGPFKYVPTRLGVHYIKRLKNKIQIRVTPPPTLRGVKKMDCVGWYCLAAKTKIYKKGFEGMEEYFPKIARFALDGYQTNNLRQMGYDLLADFSLWCKHMNLAQNRIVFWGKNDAIPMVDIWLPMFGEYAQGIPIKWKKKLSQISSITSLSQIYVASGKKQF